VYDGPGEVEQNFLLDSHVVDELDYRRVSMALFEVGEEEEYTRF